MDEDDEDEDEDGKDNDDPHHRRCALSVELQSLQALMSLYLRNAVTEQILFKPVRVNVRDVLLQARTFLARDLGSSDAEMFAMLDALGDAVGAME